MENYQVFEKEISSIVHEDIKEFAITALNNLPNYFYEVAASSTGKYHPAYALGNGGLVRHTCAAARFAIHLLQLEQFKNQYSDRERDLIIVALLLHDGWKHGNDGDSFTVHEHPQVCADWIRNNEIFNDIINMNERQLIADAIASHMGEWNTNKRSSIVLNKPYTEIEKFVHMCDYLASRKDIEILFDNNATSTVDTLENFVFRFGKHKGTLLMDVYKKDKSYLTWLRDNTKLSEPLKSFIPKLLDNESNIL